MALLFIFKLQLTVCIRICAFVANWQPCRSLYYFPRHFGSGHYCCKC